MNVHSAPSAWPLQWCVRSSSEATVRAIALLAGHGARQAARRARKTAERRAAGFLARPNEGREYRIGSLLTRGESRFSRESMELIQAVSAQDFEKAKVRRPLEAVSSTEYGPSRAVCLGLGQWTLDAVVARPIRPCCVESSPYVRRPLGNFDAACRRSSMPVTTPRSVARTLPCHHESPKFSPPPSPEIAVSATF